MTLSILRGELAPGSHLPPVRELARRQGVNPHTIQRAVDRLEASGLVETRQGSGVTVCDPEGAGDLTLVPAWLEALADDAEAAARVLDEFLEVRRVLAARLLVRHRAKLLAALPALVELAAGVSTADAASARAFDLAFAREALRLTGNRVAQAVFHTAARVLDEVPAVARAMYARPEENATSLALVLQLLQAELPDPERAAALEQAIAEVDARTVARFREHAAAGVEP